LTATSTLSVNGATILYGALTSYGNATLSNLTATGTLSVTGIGTFNDNVDILGDADITGPLGVADTLTVSSGGLNVTGNSTLTGDLNVTGASNVNTGATVTVCSSTANANWKCDYTCDGTADQVQINAAAAELVGTGGRIQLTEGVFTVNDTVVISWGGIQLEGISNSVRATASFEGTTIKLGNNVNKDVIRFTSSVDLRTSAYEWTVSDNDADEYYVTLVGGGNPYLTQPGWCIGENAVYTSGTLGALTTSDFGWGNNESPSLGFNTVYVRTDGTPADPDSLVAGNFNLKCSTTSTVFTASDDAKYFNRIANLQVFGGRDNNTTGDCIEIDPNYWDLYMDNVFLSNCNENGINAHEAWGHVIQSSVIEFSDGAGISYDCSNGYCQNARISNNKIIANEGSAIKLKQVDYSTISGNLLGSSSTTNSIVDLTTTAYSVINGNAFKRRTGQTGYDINYNGAANNHNIITDNIFSNAGGGVTPTSIFIRSTLGANVITDNIFKGYGTYEIEFYDEANAAYSKSVIKDNITADATGIRIKYREFLNELEYDSVTPSLSLPSTNGEFYFKVQRASTEKTFTNFLDVPVGRYVLLRGGPCTTDCMTIPDSAPFSLNAPWVQANGDTLLLYIESTTIFREVSRSDI
jgi:hypothetical protein